MESPHVLRFGTGGLAVFSTRAPDKEDVNEDAAAVVPAGEAGGLLAVADGMGGVRSGELAARHCVTELVNALQEPGDGPEVLRTAVLNAFEHANRAVIDLGVGAASTFAVVTLQDRRVRSFHAGDSMIMLVGQRGRVKLQTVAHSPVGYAQEAGLMEEDEALQHDDRHIISNMVGSPGMRIEVGPSLLLAPRDTLLLATDGLSDNLITSEIVELIRKGPLDRAALGLAGRCRERMGGASEGRPSKPDDLTFLLYRPEAG